MRLLFHFILASAILGTLTCSAQHEADKWYFGSTGDGLNFTDLCDPTILNDGAIDAWEGCLTVSDRMTGDLLFYTNSEYVWDRDHTIMPNGDIQLTGVIPQNTIAQVLSIPVPDEDSLYFIFTNHVQSEPSTYGIRLACLDMTLNNGYGDLLFKDSLIYPSQASEKITAIRHANGTDIWVVAHSHTGDAFLSHLVTTQGLQGPWVTSNVGKSYASLSTDQIGEMKADPSGEKLAVTTYHKPHIELFDFDRSTGIVSDPIVIPAMGGYDPVPPYSTSLWYGVSFSPDGTKLYAARQNSINPNTAIIQMDVTSDDSALIAASKTTITTLNDCFSLQLAPNGKIYTRRIGNYLGVINYPDSSGTSCGFDPEGIDFGYDPDAAWVWGFNNYISLTNFPCLGHFEGLNEVEPESLGLSVGPNPCQGNAVVHFIEPPIGPVLIELWDCLSRRVLQSSQQTHSSQMDIDLAGVQPSTYILKATVHGRLMGTAKLVVIP